VSDTPPAAAADLQQKYRQLLELAPLATALAGLPPSAGRLFTEEQVEGRALTLRIAMRWAKSLADEASGGDPQKYRQMIDLLPVTIALAGLPPSEARLFGEEQIEARSMTARSAFKVARSTAREYLGGS
jgi:hypothetical protein